ncbi:hypothetical protein GOD54_23655 [Sinorhizobium medicae]|nr:hypothetical protein [Sinorhizobium medicae]
MMPDNVFSSAPAKAGYLPPDTLSGFIRQTDYELGGIAVNDPSRGLQYQTWRCYYDKADQMVHLANEVGLDVALFKSVGLTQLALSFDFNMRPVVAYTESGVTWLRLFGSSLETLTKLLIPSATQPRLTLDDKRQQFSDRADILFFYIKGSTICMRIQRESFLTERIVATDITGTRLGRCGMTTGNRVQLELLP